MHDKYWEMNLKNSTTEKPWYLMLQVWNSILKTSGSPSRILNMVYLCNREVPLEAVKRHEWDGGCWGTKNRLESPAGCVAPSPKSNKGINYWNIEKLLNWSDVWRWPSRIEGIFVVEQILEVEELLLTVSPTFLVWLTKWMVAGSVLQK